MSYTQRVVKHKQVCTSVHLEEQKNCPSPCPAKGSNPGSADWNSDALTTELCTLDTVDLPGCVLVRMRDIVNYEAVS